VRVVFVSPYDDRCYGPRLIASWLRKHGHEVWLIIFKKFQSKSVSLEHLASVRHPAPGDFSPVTETVEDGSYVCCYVEPITDKEWTLFTEKLSEYRPELVGLSLTTPTWPVGKEITARIRREFPGVPVVWGGVHPSIAPEKCVEHADIVCVGDGEHTMLDIVNDPERTDIAGTWRRVNGEAVRNPTRPLEQNLDVFPFASWGENECILDWDQVVALPATKREYFRGIYFTMTQRGCPFACTYCYNHIRRAQHKGERYVRRRSVDHALAECEQRVRDFGLEGFAFMDDVFVKDRPWLEEFAAKWPKRIGLPFGGYAHPGVSDEDMIRMLVDVGLSFVTLGIQSGSQYIAHEVYNRRQSFDSILELAQICEKYGLNICYDMLSNCDYEREEDCRETLELLTRLPRPRLIQVKGLGVFPPFKIAELDFPKVCLPEATFEFWNTLYLMSRHRDLPADPLIALGEDDYLKKHPDVLRAVALGLKQLEDAHYRNVDEIARLKARQDEASLRGLLRYAKRLVDRSLPRPLADTIKRILGRSPNAADSSH